METKNIQTDLPEADFEKLRTLKRELPWLTRILENGNFNTHSDSSRNIGRMLGNPTVWNSTAFVEIKKYLNGLDRREEFSEYFKNPETKRLINDVYQLFSDCSITYDNARVKAA